MGIDIQRLVDSTMLKGVSVWKEYPGTPGFEVQAAYVSKQAMFKIVEQCTERVWNKDERRWEDKLSREKVARIWAEQVVIGWRGLTLEKFQKIFPIDVAPEDKLKVVEPTLENRIALLWNSVDFENWCLGLATNPETFVAVKEQKERELAQLEKQ